MRTIILKYTISIIVIIFLVLAIMAFDKKILEEDKLLLKTRFKTWGIIQDVYHSKSGHKVEVLFYYKNKSCEFSDLGFANKIDEGNYYSIAIDTNDIENNPLIDWSEQRIMPDTNNVYIDVFDFNIDKDTTVMGWNEISYTYKYKNKKYKGTRFIKNELLTDSSFNSLKCLINKNKPLNSYLFWPNEMPLFCE